MLTIQEICDECQPLAYRFGRDLFLKRCLCPCIDGIFQGDDGMRDFR